MAEVKCVARQAVPLPDGRMLAPGRHAKNVDLDDEQVAAYVTDGALLPIEARRQPARRSTTPEKE